MNLLILTQTVDANDPVLGFFVRWIEEFSKHCEHVTVICLYEGEHQLPPNVRVLSLGKEKGASRFSQILTFYRYIWIERHAYDAVFVHINQIYIILGGILWRAWHKKIGLWYTHKQVCMSLRIATYLADIIFTASPESFRLQSRKVHVVGHGIDTALFHPKIAEHKSASLRLITVGRIASSKGIEMILDVCDELARRQAAFSLDLVGADDVHDPYTRRVRERAATSPYADRVRFLGARSQSEVAALLPSYDVFVHASYGTGSLDKAPLEAMSAGVPVVSVSEAFVGMLEPYQLSAHDSDSMADAIESLRDASRHAAVARALREEILKKHELSSLAARLVRYYELMPMFRKASHYSDHL